ncbi:hypothetical protein DL95DRAFT_103050 [Leptodontidium sp. 2 PMI_412]|nr:hypothetical protein DL95DRAFT_103050 [Leptodontidium sp. 2 PMI_412]
MTTCTYTLLDGDQDETRFLKLLPGNFSDEVRIEIFHAYLFKDHSVVIKSESSPRGTSKTESGRDSTRDGSAIHLDIAERGETLSGDTESIHYGNEVVTSSRPAGKAETGDVGNDLHPPFDGKYEALSYTWGSSEYPQSIAVVK